MEHGHGAWTWTLLRREGQGFPRTGRAAPRDFPRAKPEENPKEQPCQPEENPVLPDSFTQIYILFLTGFRNCPPKIHSRCRIGPFQVTLHLLLPEFHSQ